MKGSIVIIVFCAAIVMSCNKNAETRVKSCCSKEKSPEPLKKLSGESVYNLSSTWTTQKEENLKLDHFREKIMITAMIFTHCESACPRIVADMQHLESALTEKERKQISFLLISMDPQRDTPSRLTEFVQDHKLNANWTLICSTPDATMEIANVLGIKVKKLDSGGFDHSNIIHVLDREGVVVNQQIGFAVQQDETLKAIRNLLK